MAIFLRSSNVLPFWILTVTAIIGLVVSQLIQDGMFLDGVLYTSVSFNLAEGRGTFWDPHFSKTVYDSFHEQPPLYFGLLALFYKVLGTSIYVERFFVLVFLGGTAFYIHKFWQLIFMKEDKIAKNSWLPILFWITMPVCFWAYTNGVEEVVMSFFALTSTYYLYVAVLSEKKVFLKILFSGILLFLSSLTKGVQGLFPLVAIGFYWLTTQQISFKKMMLYSFYLLTIVVTIYSFLLIAVDGVYESYYKYFESRIITTFNDARVIDSRFYLLRRLTYELLPMLVATAIFLFIKKKTFSKAKEKSGLSLWLFLVGLSGALPLLVTLEQRSFYLVTTLPFFSLAIAMWLAPAITSMIEKIEIEKLGFKVFKIITLILLVGSIVFTEKQIGKIKRYKDFLPDVYTFGTVIPKGDIVNTKGDLDGNWGLKTTMIRHNYISLFSGEKRYKYLIIKKDASKDLIPLGYNRVPIKTQALDLYINEKVITTKK
ncbi:MAG: glycosyltransferase family 39 protein [Vicingus serpentipes]|nr:glycosyltransferase family 39 protein [Vicingus serpentipes]